MFYLITTWRNYVVCFAQRCPNFSDWTWAQAIVKSEGIRNDYGDWFMVSFEMIDESDPDCIWRTREPQRKREQSMAMVKLCMNYGARHEQLPYM